MSEQELKARELVIKFQFQNPPLMFDVAKNCAIISINNSLEDLKESLEVCKELHPHAEGLIAGSIVNYNQILEIVKKL